MPALILPYKGNLPDIDSDSFVAPNAVVAGRIALGERSSVWFGCVLRGDVSYIKIGENTNVQDGTTIHVTRPNHLMNGAREGEVPTIIGDNVTIGHNCIIHACEIENNCFIGMGSILLDGAKMEVGSMLGAGSLLTCGKTVKRSELWVGRPAKFVRNLSEEEIKYFQTSADNYWELAKGYL